MSGADSRAVPKGSHGFTKYGCVFRPRAVLALGSCTASSPSPRAFRAAGALLGDLHEPDATIGEREDAIAEKFGEIRGRLKDVFVRDDVHEDVDVVLAPSGTDIEFLPCALALAGCDPDQKLTNIVVAPAEVGSGTILAAKGQLFDPKTPAGEREKGEPLCPEMVERVTRVDVQVRHEDGRRRELDAIDAEVEGAVEAAMAAGDVAIVHRVAHTKTGIFAPSIAKVTELKDRFPGKVHVVVDAAQSRISRGRITAALERGSMLFVTGSKFYGGPPFSAAIFVPKSMRPETPLREEMGLFWSQHLFPATWKKLVTKLPRRLDRGLALRWEAALAEIETFWAIKPEIRHRIFHVFEALVRKEIGELDGVELHGVAPQRPCEGAGSHRLEGHQTVFPFTVRRDGRYWNKEELNGLHAHLNTAEPVSVHLGQPVRLGAGDRFALRAAIGAPLVNDIAMRKELGETLDERLDWLREQFRALPSQIRRYVNTSVERSA